MKWCTQYPFLFSSPAIPVFGEPYDISRDVLGDSEVEQRMEFDVMSEEND